MKIKNSILICTLTIIGFVIITNSCNKKDNNVNEPTIQVPIITTATVSNITTNTATCGGNVTSDGGSAVTVRGVCWSTGASPTISDSKTNDSMGTGSFTSSITGLIANTTYSVRAYATNSKGTNYGSSVQFTTQQGTGGTVTDIEGNVYNIVTIGTQIWMAENLKVTKYSNGDPIPNITDGTQWAGLSTGAYCSYNNIAVNVSTYGNLYNWYAVSDNRNICPAGWHIPTDAEWSTLTTFLGGESIAGGKMKEAGTTHWAVPNTGATNESGFTALPGGWRGYDGSFHDLNYTGYWWSFTPYSTSSIWERELYQGTKTVGRYNNPKYVGFSIRCIKD